ncbi:TerC family protein [Fodinibius halophilus]|uniref:TerC family protein n=1 Tax=Fodinibius halophilus TaxID=1736908 RepID=A0A6M1T2T2_9BACT|nr:TerC family protein [Fodinibius halophilus]NGP88349.1 TerC family protein [Fodinibius halophilus]
MDHSILLWTVFNIFIIAMLIIDLTVFHDKDDKETIRQALIWTGVWIALALIFGVGIYYYMGTQTALDYYTGYLIEKSLSVDNIFVFLLVFSYFKVPEEYQHKVLFWGIFGALIMRFLFIFTGVALLERFHWIIYIFGGFLVFTGIKLAFEKDKEVHPERNPILKLVRKIIPTTKSYHGSAFFIRKMGKLIATPLFVVVVVIETTDVVFALDSIPAILAITRDEFIVYSSNAFAILGLRALYFALSGIMRLFHYLHYGLSAILVFVGIKMLLADFYHIPTPFALGFIAFTLAASVIASIMYPLEEAPIDEEDLPDEE